MQCWSWNQFDSPPSLACRESTVRRPCSFNLEIYHVLGLGKDPQLLPATPRAAPRMNEWYRSKRFAATSRFLLLAGRCLRGQSEVFGFLERSGSALVPMLLEFVDAWNAL